MTWILAARAFLKRIPWQWWLAIAIAIALVIGVAKHGSAIEDLKTTSFNAGYAKAVADGKATAERRAAADAAIANQLRSKVNEQNHIIARAADDLRVRGPGKARCANPATVPAAAGGRVAPGGATDGAAARVPDEDWIALPYGWTVDQAELADLNRAEVLIWREWHRKLTEEWAKPPVKP